MTVADLRMFYALDGRIHNRVEKICDALDLRQKYRIDVLVLKQTLLIRCFDRRDKVAAELELSHAQFASEHYLIWAKTLWEKRPDTYSIKEDRLEMTVAELMLFYRLQDEISRRAEKLGDSLTMPPGSYPLSAVTDHGVVTQIYDGRDKKWERLNLTYEQFVSKDYIKIARNKWKAILGTA